MRKLKEYCCDHLNFSEERVNEYFYQFFDFQMRAAFVTLVLASAGLAAELGREARSLDLVFDFFAP